MMAHQSLPSVDLAPGQETSGFIYFPKLDAPSGTSVNLLWQVQDENGQMLGQVTVPIIVQEYED
jgi:hypothetical protein